MVIKTVASRLLDLKHLVIAKGASIRISSTDWWGKYCPFVGPI